MCKDALVLHPLKPLYYGQIQSTTPEGAVRKRKRRVRSMARVYNFSAGPSMLPEKVLRQAQAELLEYGDSGQSVMEMSHRSKWFDAKMCIRDSTT